MRQVTFIGLKRDGNAALDGPTISAQSLGSFKTHQAGLAIHVPLPATHRHRPALVHQKAIACIDFICRRKCGWPSWISVEGNTDALAAVDDVVQQAPVAPCGIGRLEQDEVGPVTHAAFRIARRFVEVDNARIDRMSRVDRKMQFAVNTLVVEREWTTLGDFEMRNSHNEIGYPL